jgi:membrane protease YdiL (CAAX protease family)
MTKGPETRGGVARWLHKTFVDPLEAVDAAMRRNLERSPGVFDRKTLWVTLSATVALALLRYLSNPTAFLPAVPWLPADEASKRRVTAWLLEIEASRYGDLVWWSCSTVVAYLLVPIVVVKVVLRERLVDFGLGLKRSTSGWPIYAAMAVFMVPVVVAAASTDAFLRKYPFFRLEPGEPIPPEFWRWELLYAVQFVALEFFFRGFMVHGLKHRLGSASILAMTTPYCMIHFGKPMAETFAAILAGLVLGAMSLKTGTIWLGAALHILVAWTMDALALYRGGFFG